MRRTLFSRAVLATFLSMTPAWTTGCGGGSGVDEPSAVESGIVSLPLVSVANGHTYRLRSASVTIYGPMVAYLRGSDDPNETLLSATLQTGSYTAYLDYYWRLERDDGAGQFVPVDAKLVSSSAQNFTIYNGTSTTISFDFETDGVIVNVGAGNLSVRVGVREIDAVCTPFGEGCAPGTWCPPTGLTGAVRRCIPHGAVDIGEPCSAPGDCVANASCFDLGGGPVCAEICPTDQVDAACASGGVCHTAGTDYGVCQP